MGALRCREVELQQNGANGPVIPPLFISRFTNYQLIKNSLHGIKEQCNERCNGNGTKTQIKEGAGRFTLRVKLGVHSIAML